MHPHCSLALGCFQWALSSERLCLRVCLCSWRCEGATFPSSGSCERGVREEANIPWEDGALCSALSTAWEGEGLGSLTMGLLRVGDDFIKVSVGYCTVLSKG